MKEDLSAGAIIDEAIAKTGLSDVGDDWFRRPLAAWSDDLHQTNLTERGRNFMRSLAVRDVARRLRVLSVLREHPEILEVEIPPIVYITGLERSGTTILHNLIALHARARAFLRWELMEPVPPPTTATYTTDPRIAAVQASVEPLRGSLLEHMHWVEATDPEECAWGFIDAISMLGQAASFCMPSWNRFLAEADLTPAFERYRQVVQLLTWQHPVDREGFLVLKSPQIGLRIAAFAEVFPEAHFVVTDRDPFRALVSLEVMGSSIVDPFCVENPFERRGPDDPRLIERIAGKLAAIQTFSESSPGRVTHVPYPDIADAPGPLVEGLIASNGLPEDRALGGRIDEFLAAQRAGRRAQPPSQIDDRGFVHDEVLAEPRIAAYCERFGIAPERHRLTGSDALRRG